MASTYTGLGTELMTTGENASTWGTKTNTNLKIIEQLAGGYIEKSIAGSAQTTTLAVSDGSVDAELAHRIIKFTGTITGNQIVTIPLDVQQMYILVNGTSGAYTVQFKYASGSGSSFTFAATDKGTKIVYATADDGTNPNLVDTGIGSTGTYDLDGGELTLDADSDTSITASTDDQIDFEIAGADDFTMTANAFNVLTGSHATFADSANAKFGTGNDMLVYHDGSNSYVTNATGALKLATETSGIALTIGHTTSETTVADNLSVTGNVTVGVDDTGGDVKFFGASAGAYALWDESADLLDIRGATAAGAGLLRLTTGELTVVDGNKLGRIDFQAPLESDGTDAIAVAASIWAEADDTFSASVNNTDIVFATGKSEAAAEKFRFTADNEIGIAGANYGTDGQVLTSGGAGAAVAWEDAATGGVTAINNATANELVTVGSTTTELDAEANLTFTGSALTCIGTITTGVDNTGHDVKFFGATSGSFFLWDESDDALELTDSSPIKIGDGGDMTIYHDGTDSFVTNAQGGLKLATETSGIAVTIGHTTSETTIADNLNVTGIAALADGTAGAPALTNTGDTNCGLFFSAADTLSFTAAGTAQFTMADGVVAPVTDDDVDLGTSSLEFKDGYFDGTLYCDTLNLAGTSHTSISGGGLVHLSTVNITSGTATVSFTSDIDSTYNAYLFILSDVHPATDAQPLEMTVSTDGGSSYISTNYSFAHQGRTDGTSELSHCATNDSVFDMSSQNVGNAADETISSRIYLHKPAGTNSHKLINVTSTVIANDNAVSVSIMGGANHSTTAAIDAVRFKFGSGNIDRGNFSMFGVANS